MCPAHHSGAQDHYGLAEGEAAAKSKAGRGQSGSRATRGGQDSKLQRLQPKGEQRRGDRPGRRKVGIRDTAASSATTAKASPPSSPDELSVGGPHGGLRGAVDEHGGPGRAGRQGRLDGAQCPVPARRHHWRQDGRPRPK
eukprot:2305427-Pyramimonas_sp.AAC.1